MNKKFKSELTGDRIVLKRLRPTIKIATEMFANINLNRTHLGKWFPWVELTKKVEDSLKYLFDEEDKTKKGEKIDYGIYFNGKHIGNVGIFDIEWEHRCAEIGYWLSSEFLRNGYMTEAVRVLERYGFEVLGLNRIQIKCDERNEASVGVAKKCGYKLEGLLREDTYIKKEGRFRSTYMFSKLKGEYDKQKGK